MSKSEPPTHWPGALGYQGLEMEPSDREAWRLGYAAAEEHVKQELKNPLPHRPGTAEFLEVYGQPAAATLEEAFRQEIAEVAGLMQLEPLAQAEARGREKGIEETVAKLEAGGWWVAAEAIRALLKKGE
jgi:hypothetical protein